MTENKITGTISAIKPSEEISGGKYRKLVFAVTNNDGYEGAEKLWAFEIFEKSDGDKISNFEKFNKVGQVVDVSYEVRCNENAGRYFTSLSAWKVFANKSSGDDASNTIPQTTTSEELLEEPPF